MHKKGEMGGIHLVIGVGVGVVLLILLYGVFATLGASTQSQMQSSFSGICATGHTWNTTGNNCYNVLSVANYSAVTDMGKISMNASSGLVTAGAQTPTIASVGGFVVIIAMLALVAAYAFGAFR